MLTWPASPQKQGKRVTSSHYGILLIRPVIVSLRLLARIEVILPDGFFGFMADALAPAKASEGLVGELRSGSQQLFVDAHQVALAARVKLQDLVAMSARTSGTKHPSPLSLVPAENNKIPAVSKDDQDHWIFSTSVKLGAGEELPLALVVKGTAQQ